MLTTTTALADCVLAPPNSITVTCDGLDANGYQESVNEARILVVNPNASVGNDNSQAAAINLNLLGGINNITVTIHAGGAVSGILGAGNLVGARHGLQLLTSGGTIQVETKTGTSVTGGGTGGDGIRARTDGAGTILMNLSGNVSTVASAADNGEAVDAQTAGDGSVTLNLHAGTYTSARSDVIVAGSTGGTVGVLVKKGVQLTGGALTTGAGDDGILVTNAGAANIIVDGTVSGVGGSAVSVMNASTVTVTNTGTSRGAESGIELGTASAVTTAIINNNSGTVEGNGGDTNAVIWANAGGSLTINNTGAGLIQATRTVPLVPITDALIVETIGIGHTIINNAANMIGRLSLTDNAANVVNNTSYSSWTFTGDSDQGNGTVNNTGRINLLDPDAAIASVARFINTAAFSNGTAPPVVGVFGFVNQLDGTTNDLGVILGANGGDTEFTGADGFSFFEQDVDLHALSTADRMIIDGNVTAGSATGLIVVDLNSNPFGGYDPNGVTLVEVTGDTALGDFYLLHGAWDGDPASVADLTSGPITKGLWTYDLFLNVGNTSGPVGNGDSRNCVGEETNPTTDSNCWVLASYAGNYSIPQTISVIQDMLHATGEMWIDRSGDLRVIHGSDGGSGADVAYGAPSRRNYDNDSGLWVRGIGQIAQRDVSYVTELFGEEVVVDGDYNTHLWAVQGGIDHSFDHDSGTAIVGLMGGWAMNKVDFVDAGDTADITAPHVGIYANLVNDNAYLDALFKADFLSIDFDVAGDQASTKGLGLGGRAEVGYRHTGKRHGFIEPVAAISYVQTQIDPVTIAGSEVTFNDGQSLRGKIGGRVGQSWGHGDQGAQFDHYLQAFLGQEFLGENSVFVDSGPGLTLTDDVSGMFGEVGGGFNLTAPEKNAALFGQANYIFADGYNAGNAKAGVRVNW